MRIKRPLLAACLCILLILWGFVMIFDSPPWDSGLSHLEGERIEVIGQVYDRECRTSYNETIQVIYLKACNIIGPNQDKFSCDNLICEVPLSAEKIRCGAFICIEGTFTSYLHATNPGAFDAADYYGGMKIAGCVKEGEVLAAGSEYSKITQWLYEFCDGLEDSLENSLDKETAQVMAKMLLGRGDELSEETKVLYQEGGIYHILSISGMHISLLGMGAYRLLRKRGVPLWVAAGIGSVMIILYGIMIGFGISAIRAIGMYLVHLLGDVTRRSYDMLTAMGVMAVGIALHNPRVLLSAGYLLSFACVFCLGFFTPALAQLVLENNRLRKVRAIMETFAGSLSISIFTLPLQLYFFYQVSVYSVLLNLLVIPFVEVLMVFGALLLMFPFMKPLAWGIEGILWIYESLCTLFLALPGSIFIAGKPKEWGIVLFYICIWGFVRMGRRKRRCGFGRGIILLLGVMLLIVPQRMQTRVTFLDVGQGDCALVQTWNGKDYLIDAGSSSSSVGKYRIVPALKCLGVNYLDAIVITHPDYDHYSALSDVLSSYGERCGGVVLPAIPKEKRTAEFAEVYREIEIGRCGDSVQAVGNGGGACLPVYYMGAGDVLYADSWTRLSCLAPVRDISYGSSNEYSIVLSMECDGFSVLFTGDIEGDGENLLCKLLATDSSIQSFLDIAARKEKTLLLKVAHHGSAGSSSEEFLRLVRPQVAIISCGRNNPYGHPHKEVLERLKDVGAKVFSTPQYGAITVEVHFFRGLTVSYFGSG